MANRKISSLEYAPYDGNHEFLKDLYANVKEVHITFTFSSSKKTENVIAWLVDAIDNYEIFDTEHPLEDILMYKTTLI